jgi:hypothetical protein
LAFQKVCLKVRGQEIWKTTLQDGDTVMVTAKGLGGAEKMVQVALKVYDEPEQTALIPETRGPETITTC